MNVWEQGGWMRQSTRQVIEDSGVKRTVVGEIEYVMPRRTRAAIVSEVDHLREKKVLQKVYIDRWSWRAGEVESIKGDSTVKRKGRRRQMRERKELSGRETSVLREEEKNEAAQGVWDVFLHFLCLWIGITCQKACCQLHHDFSIMEQHWEPFKTMCVYLWVCLLCRSVCKYMRAYSMGMWSLFVCLFLFRKQLCVFREGYCFELLFIFACSVQHLSSGLEMTSVGHRWVPTETARAGKP